MVLELLQRCESVSQMPLNYENKASFLSFEDTIVSQFYGHSHFDELNVYYEDPEDHKSRPTAVVYSAPSVTPNFAFNPAYRVYTIDGNYPGSSFVGYSKKIKCLIVVNFSKFSIGRLVS